MGWIAILIVVVWAALGLRQLKTFKLKYAEAHQKAFAPLNDLGKEMDKFGREHYDGYNLPAPEPVKLDKPTIVDEVNDVVASMVAGPFFSSFTQDILDRLERMEKENKELVSIFRNSFHEIRETVEKQDSEKEKNLFSQN